MTDFVDQFRNYIIHEDDYKTLPVKVRNYLDNLESIEFYPAGLKNGKKFNKVNEFRRLIRHQQKIIKDNKGEESNPECMIIDQMIEVLRRLPAKDFRKLHLEKLL